MDIALETVRAAAAVAEGEEVRFSREEEVLLILLISAASLLVAAEVAIEVSATSLRL